MRQTDTLKARTDTLLLAFILLAAIAALSGRIVDDVENRAITSKVKTHFIREPVEVLFLDCLTPALVERVRARKSIDVAFGRCAADLARVLGPEFAHLERKDLRVIFAMLVAHGMAPAGSSQAVEFEALLKAPALACDGYARLVTHLAGDRVRMRMAGFDGGAVGNHAQLFYSRDSVHLLLDPTIALVALVDFKSLLGGKPIAGKMIRHFYARDELRVFLSSAVHALLNGRYRAEDLLYYFDGLNQ